MTTRQTLSIKLSMNFWVTRNGTCLTQDKIRTGFADLNNYKWYWSEIRNIARNYYLGIGSALMRKSRIWVREIMSLNIPRRKDDGISYDFFMASLLPLSIKWSMYLWVACDGPCLTQYKMLSRPVGERRCAFRYLHYHMQNFLWLVVGPRDNTFILTHYIYI